MNWDAIGAVGEILGAIAVVVSLVYLALQIRTQNKESRIASVHEISEGYRQTISKMLDPNLSDAFIKGVSDYDGLNEGEKLRVLAFILTIFKLYEEAYYQYKADRLDSYVWDGMIAQFVDFYSTDSCKKVWNLRKHQFSQEFQDLVDKMEGGNYVY